MSANIFFISNRTIQGISQITHKILTTYFLLHTRFLHLKKKLGNEIK